MTFRFAMALSILSAVLAAPLPAAAQNAANGAELFKKCRACHDVGANAKNKVGPLLNGVYGRAAAGVPDFNYSEAMKQAGAKKLVWDDESLSGYLEAPTTYLPKNKMAFAGVKNEKERADLIAFLKTLK